MSQDIASALPIDDDAQATALALYFEGDLGLYQDYRAMCVAQFPQDVLAGDEACAAKQGATLQSVGHSMKTVLRLLGQPALSELASQIERFAHDGDVLAACKLWPALRDGLKHLSAGGD